MPHPYSCQDAEANSDIIDNECEDAEVNSDTRTGTQYKPGKRLYQWEMSNDTEDVTQDGFQLVQTKKKSKNSVSVVKSASVQEMMNKESQESNAAQATHRLSFPKGVLP
ncbi:hypothetical protein E2C01_072747 [Portunus trituberculatus]|uniref:Uncharacterized protein n=1 Tax=Portunus trituberculatus TaxID=210409 RepID=A0A5B7I3F1_PORTR|nr:hypothetical protein [Portunus trituberculatus]